jgi:hypothetical protein
VGKVRGEIVTNTVIKVDPNLWPLPTSTIQDRSSSQKINYDEKLSQTLLALPPSFAINVDPDDLL